VETEVNSIDITALLIYKWLDIALQVNDAHNLEIGRHKKKHFYEILLFYNIIIENNFNHEGTHYWRWPGQSKLSKS
jgi:hypothetical protein